MEIVSMFWIRMALKLLANYERFFPDFALETNWWAVIFIIMGITILVGLEWYGKKRRRKN